MNASSEIALQASVPGARRAAGPRPAGGLRRAGGALLVALLVGTAGCSSVALDEGKGAPIGSSSAAGQGSADRNAAGAAQQSSRPVAEVSVAPDPLNDPKSPLAQRSIYFDYDSFVVKDQYRSTVEAHARYLGANRGRRVAIQGNTDERGSREYNLALGQKRAEAVRQALSVLGVPESQMEAVSLGEEKPRSTARDEASFAENRRADLVYQ